MGSNLTNIANSTHQKDNSPLLNITLSKLREFFGSFKSVCDNFSIDLIEFEQIFGANESSFVVWDVDKNGLIDALELFSGLILFSDSKFDDKIRFLFDLFDLNELNSLSPIDIEFMIYSSIGSTYKIFGVKQEVNVEEISKFVEDNFTQHLRFNITELIKFAWNNPQVQQFFSIIKKEPEELPNGPLKMTSKQGGSFGQAPGGTSMVDL
jgi:hypothetical protein